MIRRFRFPSISILALTLTLVVISIASPGSAPTAGAAGGDADDVIPGRYIVVLEDGASAADGAADHGLRPSHIYRTALNGFAAAVPAPKLSALAADPRVESVGQDRVVRAVTQTLPTGVNRIDADLAWGTKTGAGIRVAVMDTGIDYDHPDLQANINANLSCSFIGGQFCGPGAPPAWDDDNKHGTHVAGTVAAVNNDIGVRGVASAANLVALKVLNNVGSGSFSDVTAAVDYVTATRTDADATNDIHVVNMSFGASCSVCTDNSTDPTIDAFHDAVISAVNAGVVIAVAAGNSGSNASTSVPASFDEVITVSAFTDYNGAGGASSGCKIFLGLGKLCDESIAKFSNYGPDVDIAAPGVQILSTLPGGTYGSFSGTSMASPHVAGVAALYLQGRTAPTSKAGVDAVRLAVMAAGECSGSGTTTSSGYCTTKWSGDKDSSPYWEPLADAQKVAALP
jgi:subtilisin family serine protease